MDGIFNFKKQMIVTMLAMAIFWVSIFPANAKINFSLIPSSHSTLAQNQDFYSDRYTGPSGYSGLPGTSNSSIWRPSATVEAECGNPIGPWRSFVDVSRNGTKSMMSSVGTIWYGNNPQPNPIQCRCEIFPIPEAMPFKGTDWRGKEMWAGFSVYLPSDKFSLEPYLSDQSPSNKAILWQNHQGDVDGRMIPFQIRIGTDGGAAKWSIQKVKPNYSGNVEQIWLDPSLYPVSLDIWHDFVFHIIWNSDASGHMEVWKGAKGTAPVKVVNFTGPTMWDNLKGVNVQFGFYNDRWRYDHYPERLPYIHAVYHDEIRVGDGNENFESVYPGTYTVNIPADTAPPSVPAGFSVR